MVSKGHLHTPLKIQAFSRSDRHFRPGRYGKRDQQESRQNEFEMFVHDFTFGPAPKKFCIRDAGVPEPQKSAASMPAKHRRLLSLKPLPRDVSRLGMASCSGEFAADTGSQLQEPCVFTGCFIFDIRCNITGKK